MKRLIPLIRPRGLLYGTLGVALACTGEPTRPAGPAPVFSRMAIDDPTRVLTVGVDAPASLMLTGAVAGIVVMVDNALVDLSKATVDCSGQAGPAPKIGVWIKGNRTQAYVKGGGTGLIRNCDIGVLIGPPLPGAGDPGGSMNRVAGLEIDAGRAIIVANGHDNIINDNQVPLTDYGIIITGLDSSASASGRNQIYGNTIATSDCSICATSDGNMIWGNVLAGMTVSAIAVTRDANLITGNRTTALEDEDPPEVGIRLRRGAEGNTITNNQVRAGHIGIEAETGAVHNLIRGNTATAHPDAVDRNGDCAHNTWVNNTFRTSEPPCIVGLTLDAVTFTSSTTIALEGLGATFTATFTNPSIRLTDVAIRTWVDQGTSPRYGAHRLGSWSWATCDVMPGVLPRGSCTQNGEVVVATNSSSGRGTLAVGGARAIIELVHVVDRDTLVVDSRTASLTLTPPAAGSFWDFRAPMPTARQALAAGVVNDTLYAVGGIGTTGSSVEAYDPATDSWTTLAEMPTPREDLGVGVVDGILYAVGGYASSGPTAVVEAYDPATNSWNSVAPMPTPRAGLAVAVIDGLVYAVGGVKPSGYSSALEVYDPLSNTWVSRAPMPTPRFRPVAGVINGILYAAGGSNSSGLPDVVEAYDPATDTWTTVAPLPTAREFPAAGVVDGALYVFGGFGRLGLTGVVEVYDPVTNSWSATLGMPTPRGYLAAGVIDDVVYTVGGFGCHDNSCVAQGVLEAFHP